MAAENVGVPAIATHKKPRKRTKEVVRKLREQVEFYFGDMNLRTGFLRAKIDQSEDGFVPIKLVASFNRVKALTSDVSVLASALRTSDLLEVSDDGQKVRRSTPLADPQSVDERTVYVEDLPPGTTLDTMQRDFGKCGAVEYIRLPRHWDSKDLKGFAYVTFSKSEEALDALKVFDNFESGLEPLFPPKATTSNAPASSTPSTVEVGEEGEGRGEFMADGGKEPSSRGDRKRQRDDGGESEDDCEPSGGDGPPQAKTKKVEDVVQDEEGGEKESKKKKRKKRKKKTKDNISSYKVLHKLEWNRLKRVYLQLQKQEMSRAKKLLAEYNKSAPQPLPAAKTSVAKAPAVACGHKEMSSKTKRGADKIIRRLEEREFLKQQH